MNVMVMKAAIAAVALTFAAACSNSTAPPDAGGIARTAITGVLAGHTMSGEAIPCVAEEDGVRVCHATTSGADLRLKSFDGTPLGTLYVTLPPAPTSGTDGGYPFVVQSHGWGAPPSGIDDHQYGGPSAREWALDGYAVLQFAARGWGESCGSAASREINPDACVNGFIRLDDYRYEIRDVQHATGLLVDEGIVDPQRIGVTGESYGAGVSLSLATLKDRVVMPDGQLVPWVSPAGTPLLIAAAYPFAGWSDLSYSLTPNGRTLDTEVTSTTADVSPPGVMKQSIMSGLYTVGTLSGYYAPAGYDAEADVSRSFAVISAGEPYDTDDARFVWLQATQWRSPYYLLAGAFGFGQVQPAPLFMANGFTDDVFSAAEVLRYHKLARSLYPTTPIEMFFMDGGHQRGQFKPTAAGQLVARAKAFFDHYVKGTAPQPATAVTVFTQTCPATAEPGGPYTAATWEALHPGVVRFSSAAAKTVLSTGGNPQVGQAFDPVAGGLACTTASAADEGPGVATYPLPTPTGAGYTLLGSPTVTADLAVAGEHAYIAARLVNVDPATNTKTLIARGLYRIDPAAPNGRQTFQLYANGWHFAPGQVPQLELLGRDAPYARPSNGTFSISVSNLELRLPVHEVPGAPGTPAEVE